MPVAFASPSAKKPALRSSTCEVAAIRSSFASESTSGVEREPGEVTAWRSPQRASSSTNARRPRYVSVGIRFRLPGERLLRRTRLRRRYMRMVLLHGFTQTRQSWRRTIAALGGRYRAVAPDLPGHGLAAERRPASFAACAAYVRAAADGPCVLVGYSMGGRIALYTALALPGLVQRLVLVGASPGIADPAE